MTQDNSEPAMSPVSRLAEIGPESLKKYLHKLHKNEEIARADEDTEGVHQMRVATRKLRAGLKILEETVYEPTKTKKLRASLKKLANSLGQVRDEDVFLGRLDAYRQTLTDDYKAQLDGLYDTFQHQRDRHHRKMLARLDDPRTAKALNQLEHFIDAPQRWQLDGPSDPHEYAPEQVRHFVGGIIWRGYEEVLAYQPHLPTEDIAVLHRLRVACKRLRYSLDFFEDALPNEVETLSKQLAATQDNLGNLHDFQVAIQAIDDLKSNPDDAPALHQYRAELQNNLQKELSQFNLHWSKLAGADFAGRLARMLAKTIQPPVLPVPATASEPALAGAGS